MSLIGLRLCLRGTVLVFRRDFKEAAGVFAVGMSPSARDAAGVSVLRGTVASLRYELMESTPIAAVFDLERKRVQLSIGCA